MAIAFFGDGNVDWIRDFDVDDDLILLDNLIFETVGGDGALSFDVFYRSASGVAFDAGDRIIYDTNLNLSADDFIVI